MQWKFPNFFVIGAAKSGTTSLYNYLAQHPDIYMSPVKEPNYFSFLGESPNYIGPSANTENPFFRDRLKREKYEFSVTSLRDYEQLFSGVRGETAIGESSVSYLYFPAAANQIRERVPDAKLIAILRDPVSRAYSKYQQFRRDGSEHLVDFAEALAAEPDRIRNNWSPTWFYVDRGFYYRQLRTYYELFERNQIHISLYEDFSSDPRGQLAKIFHFLGVSDDFEVDLSEKHNVSENFRVPRHLLLYDLFMRPSGFSSTVRRLLPNRITNWSRPMIRKVITREASETDATPLSDEIARKLKRVFRDDIENLQKLIQRDLSSWL